VSRKSAGRHVAVRLEVATIAKIDTLIPALSTACRKAKRSDVFRALIIDELGARTSKTKTK
jgi:hypothetical protein